MDNPKEMETWGTQGEEKQNKNTTQYVMDTTIRKHTQITHIRHEASYQQLEVQMNRTSVVCGNRNVLC